jgi:hypothetical protein
MSVANAQTSPAPYPQTSTTQTAPRPPATQTPWRYGGISGAWLIPSGDFSKLVNDGWAITLEGYQFVDPTKKIAVGTEIGYYDFGEKSTNDFGAKNTFDVATFPVDFVLKIFPKGDQTKARPFLCGGLGFNYVRTDINHSSASDYYFGTQAGGGLTLHGSGAAAFKIDGVYHWVFTNGTDIDFWSVRAGLLIPMAR